MKTKKLSRDDQELAAYNLHTKAFLAVFKAYVRTQWGPRCVPPNTQLDPKDACGSCHMWGLYDRAKAQVK